MIKVVRSNRGIKYYGKHGSTGQFKGSFAKYLEDCGIVAQYTILGSPNQNEVIEIHNRTLKDMVKTIMSRCDLPILLWDEALRAAIYILNRISSKSMPKTLFEL